MAPSCSSPAGLVQHDMAHALLPSLQEGGAELARSSLLTIMKNIGNVPLSLRQAFIDNAGG